MFPFFWEECPNRDFVPVKRVYVACDVNHTEAVTVENGDVTIPGFHLPTCLHLLYEGASRFSMILLTAGRVSGPYLWV